MRTFLRRVGTFGAIQAPVLAGLLAFHLSWGADQQHYLAAWGDKHARLERTPRPRLILVGGSNLAMGIDSVALERGLGLPVVNLGLHGGLGLEFMLREAEAACGAGDVVVLSVEISLLIEPLADEFALDLLELYPSAARFLGPDMLPLALDRGLAYVGKLPKSLVLYVTSAGIRRAPGDVYTRATFNAHGDATAHRDRAPRRPLMGRVEPERGGAISPEALTRGIARLNRFAAHCRSRDAAVFWSSPPLPENDVRTFEAKLDAIDGGLRRGLAMPILNETAELSLPDRLFFDSVKHLTGEGTEQRTVFLRARLDEALRGLPRPCQWAADPLSCRP